MGNPVEMAQRYAESGAHELLYIDTVASLYGRNQLETLIQETSERVFVPITVGGGITDCKSVARLLRAGADKVAVNTAALKRPELIQEIADQFGSQAITISIQCKRTADRHECYCECGREPTGRDVRNWAERVISLGAGEILLTSIDCDGTMKGCDLDLLREVSGLAVPLVAGGGIGTQFHVIEALSAGADAVAIGSALHYNKLTFAEVEHGITESNLSRETNQSRAA